ncbi:hypothetical protein JTB14_023565, partial [Gonioctena quinquepunctata]
INRTVYKNIDKWFYYEQKLIWNKGVML